MRNAFQLVVFVLAALACHAQQKDCTVSEVSLRYLPLAKAARIFGTVVADVRVEGDGTATILRTDGPPLLVLSTREAVSVLHFPDSCSGLESKIKVHF
jgi:hypothetical protein